MDIRKVFINGFGQLNNKEIDFCDGINVIYAENEGGKSTLHTFIESMFYHNYKAGIKRRVREEKIEKYKPWNTSAYGGSMSIFDSGDLVHIEKDFSSKNTMVKIYNDNGEDLSENYEMDEVFREADFAARHLGLSKIMFRNTVSISQLSRGTDENTLSEVKKYISNIEKANDATISVNRVIERINEEKNKIGSIRKSKSPYGLREKRIKELANRLLEAKKTEQELNRLRDLEEESKQDLSEISEKIDEVNKDLLEVKKLEKNKIKEEADKLNLEIKSINEELGELERFEKFSYQLVSGIKENLKNLESLNVSKQVLINETKSLQTEKLSLLEDVNDFNDTSKLASQKKDLKKDRVRISELQKEIELENQKLTQKNQELEQAKGSKAFLLNATIASFLLLVALGLYFTGKAYLYVLVAFIISVILGLYHRNKSRKIILGIKQDLSNIQNTISVDNSAISTVLSDKDFENIDDLDESLERVSTMLSLALLKEEERAKTEKKVLSLDALIKEKYEELDVILEREVFLKNKLESVKQEFGILELEDLDDFYLKGKEYEKKREKLDFLKKIFEEKLGEFSYEELRFEDVERKIEGVDKLDLERLKSELNKRYYSKKEEMEKISENIRIVEESSPSIQAIEEEIQALEVKRVEDDKRIRVLDIVLEKIAFSIKNVQSTVMPEVNKRVSEVVSVATGGKYDDIKVSSDLKVFVKDKKSAKLVKIEDLSVGTIDLIYIGLRISMASLVNGDKKVPLLFDDSFAQIDDSRLENLLAYLSKLGRQIFIFTCHKREAKTLEILKKDYRLIEM